MPADVDKACLDEATRELVSQAVAEACKPLHTEIHRLAEITERAKATIRNLLRQLYGSRAETLPVLFDVEGQIRIQRQCSTVEECRKSPSPVIPGVFWTGCVRTPVLWKP